MRKFTEVEKAYLAGIIDGEGCLSVSKEKSPKGEYKILYKAHLKITNTNQKLIQWLEKIIGKCYIKTDKGDPKWKLRFSWIMTDRDKMFPLLKEILPYLILKKKQAKLILKLRKGKQKKGIAFDVEERKFREKLYQSMKKLNQKGNKA